MFHLVIQTEILRGIVFLELSVQVAPVLSGPSRGTGVGGGYHDGGGVMDPAHGAGDVVVPMLHV